MLANIIMEKLFDGVKLSHTDIVWICQSVKRIFLSQPILLDLKPPVIICGDTHGQFHDTCRLFESCGDPADSNYLFLGDYVDRGAEGIENTCLLFLYKIIYPQNFFLIRGNHECSNMTRQFGFFEECEKKYDKGVWKLFCDVFNCLPIAAIIESRIFCVHGGISPDLNSMDDIKNIKRPIEVPENGLLCDLLWSDPNESTEEWSESDRGTGVLFGLKPVNDFLEKFDFDLICRAHQAVKKGYSFPFSEEVGLITIFSAPNYLNFGNLGGAMIVDSELNCTFTTISPDDNGKNEYEIEEEEEKREEEQCVNRVDFRSFM